MAFDFLGTFNIDQLIELETFLNEKLIEFDNQSNHLVIEANRVKNLKNKYEVALKNLGAPTNSDGILVSKRIEKVEDSTYKWVNKVFEDQLFETVKLRLYNDSPSSRNDVSKAVIMSKIKKPFTQEIKFQREKLEYRIRKCGDLIEQLEEQRTIKLIAKQETEKYLNLIKEISAAEAEVKTFGDISTF